MVLDSGFLKRHFLSQEGNGHTCRVDSRGTNHRLDEPQGQNIVAFKFEVRQHSVNKKLARLVMLAQGGFHLFSVGYKAKTPPR